MAATVGLELFRKVCRNGDPAYTTMVEGRYRQAAWGGGIRRSVFDRR